MKSGQKVTQGQLVGYTGSAGNSTGPHMHFEIRDLANNTNLNPMADNNYSQDMMPASHFYESAKRNGGKFGPPDIIWNT